jgi:hypothetical protein
MTRFHAASSDSLNRSNVHDIRNARFMTDASESMPSDSFSSWTAALRFLSAQSSDMIETGATSTQTSKESMFPEYCVTLDVTTYREP